MKISRGIAATAVLASAVAGTAALAPQASAATRAAYNGACGSGYKVVNSAPIGSKGTVFLTYNSAKGKNCVVTVRNSAGSPVSMFAYLYAQGASESVEDSGLYRSYAGPVYTYGRGKCVDWAGGIDNQSTWTYGSNCGSLKAYRVTKGW
ncbi:spore-associated protein A [Streptomyces sp. NA02950]|uniref:spore-associated protein A n=1 Tax=Streptomyces sp. NA02950 TaxID=2742137 RepID=UPI0015922943|nr:spore-associated protein A [Streptomyces sp. NA02950]QKV96596.1 spore-associated protein A [Streptomyces sp. NA02950]